MAPRKILAATIFIVSLSIWSFDFSMAEGSVPALFVFGDSLVDTGNNNYLPISFAKAIFPHYGIDFPTKKPTGRFSNGKIAADFFAEKVGLPYPPPYLSMKWKWNDSFVSGVNFASGGARIFNGSKSLPGQAIPLSGQVDFFTCVLKDLKKKMEPSGAANHLSRSLFAVVIGGNDILGYVKPSILRRKNAPEAYVDMMATTLKEQLKRLYEYGARKFAVAGVVGVGCIPDQRVKNPMHDCNEEANHWTLMYNERLKTTLEELKSELQGMSYSYFDNYRAMQDVLRNPKSYGFNEIKAACCGLGELNAQIPCLPITEYCPNRRDHVFWDLFHPTEAVVGMFMNIFFYGSLPYTYPLNIKQLIAV